MHKPMKLVIKNDTQWAVADLRPLIERALKEEQFERNRLTVNIYYTRGRHHGKYGPGTIWMGLPSISQSHLINSQVVAKILCWCLRAERGMSRKDMPIWQNIPAEWAKEFDIRLLESDAKPKKGVQARRYEAAVKKLTQFQKRAALLTRAKSRNDKLIKKWAKKARYYEVMIAKKEREARARRQRSLEDIDL